MIYSLKCDSQSVELLNLEGLDPTLKFDIQYARDDNFFNRKVYTQPRAFLLKHVAEDLHRVHQSLRSHGLGLLIFDGYRPWSVTKLFWDESNENNRQYLANPETGSAHNRGCAVDLSLYHLKTGESVVMPSEFDEMNEKAHTHYAGGDPESMRWRDLLQEKMHEHHFIGIRFEWWHFNHLSHRDWPVMNFSFEQILDSSGEKA